MTVKRFIELDCNGEQNIKREYTRVRYSYDDEWEYFMTETRDGEFYYGCYVTQDEWMAAWEGVRALYERH